MLVSRLRFDWFPALAVLLLFIISWSACTQNDVNKSDATPVLSGPPNTTFPMPPMRGKSVTAMGWELSDGTHNLVSDYKGKVLLLDFYATWCAPCRESVPHLIELQRRHDKDGLMVVGLNVGGSDDLDKISDFARELRVQYTLAMPDQDLTNLLLSGDKTIPQTFVFDRKGLLLKRFIGYEKATGDEINEVVEIALASPSD